MISVNIETNPPDVLRAGKIFTFKEGQTILKGEIVLEDGAEMVFPDTASLIVE